MLHAALRWPGMSEKILWPLALSHAAYLYNRIPLQQTGDAPIEVWMRTRSDHHALQLLHPWGCPVYVLDPKLRDDGKLPKWDPRSRRGQYIGASPYHSSSVGLVRNLQTGSITPQYHLVYDNFFETVHNAPGDEPTEWPDLVVFNRFRNEFDEDGEPELQDDWLSPEELSDRKQKEAERRQAATTDPSDAADLPISNRQILPEQQRELQMPTTEPPPAPTPTNSPVPNPPPTADPSRPTTQPRPANREPTTDSTHQLHANTNPVLRKRPDRYGAHAVYPQNATVTITWTFHARPAVLRG
jgi:hypothetical protein